jgi:hypothetical protein
MTTDMQIITDELDKAVCIFAGIPTAFLLVRLEGEFDIYPTVSSDGKSMLQLMDALENKGVYWKLSGNAHHDHSAYVRLLDGETAFTAMAAHKSASMALALAVRQLAQECADEN